MSKTVAEILDAAADLIEPEGAWTQGVEEDGIMSEEHLLLKWGTLKGWGLGENEAARAAFQRYADGGMAMGAMQQHDSPEQKQALRDLIDAINGKIQNDWTGDRMTKDEAKKYVLEYDR